MSNHVAADAPIDIEPPPEPEQRRISVSALKFWALNLVDRCRTRDGKVSPESFVRVDSEDIAHFEALDRFLNAILRKENDIADVLRGRPPQRTGQRKSGNKG